MAVDHLFSGSAIGSVRPDGAVRLPSFVRRAIERRSSARTILLGAHEKDACATGWDPGYGPLIHADLERLRLRDEAGGLAPDAHHARLRRTFGLVEEARYGEDGRLVLPPMTRRRSGIGALALFVGTGGNFEIWDPQRARDSGCEGLRELADYRLAAEGRDEKEEDE